MIASLSQFLVGPNAAWRRRVLVETIRGLRDRARPVPRECPVCGHSGLFNPTGWPIRLEAACPGCGSLERHRLLALWIAANPVELDGKEILHFAAESFSTRTIGGKAARYVTADIAPGRDLVLDIERLELPDSCFDVVINSHVLEHVDDGKALREIHRVLRPGGLAITMIPLIEGWDSTYENPEIVSPEEREAHFGQADHVRYFGADFRMRASAAGFRVGEHTAEEPEVARYGLLRGEKVFLLRKP